MIFLVLAKCVIHYEGVIYVLYLRCRDWIALEMALSGSYIQGY